MGHAWVPNEQFDTNGILSWGSKLGQIRSQGISNMILFAGFRPFFSFFVFLSPQKNTISAQNFFEDFFSMKQDTVLILKLLITYLKELVVGQGSFSAKCIGLFIQINWKCIFLTVGADILVLVCGF